MGRAALLEGEAESFRLEVCRFLSDALSPARIAGHADLSDRTGLDHAFERALQREAGRRGYLGISVDAEHGGGGKPAGYAAAFQYEAAYHDAPLVDTAVVLAAAPLIAFGTAEQRARLLPPMLAGAVEMCIAYTEPAAGNDLSGISTTASPGEGGFVLRGTKTLVTGADKADHCLTIAVTDASADVRHRLSMFLVDMGAPGVSVSARKTMAGYALWDVVFEDAPGALVGGEGDGWRQLAAAVEGERTATFGLGWCQRLFDELLRFSVPNGVLGDAWAADAIAGLWADLQAARRFALAPRGRAAGSMAKVFITELAQRLAAAATALAGPAGAIEGSFFGGTVPYAPAGGRFCFEYLFRVDGPISVGANELHRDTIARSGSALELLPGGAPLRGEVRAFLAARHDPGLLDALVDAAPGYDRELWAALGQTGWLACAGPDGRVADLAVVASELGYARVPTPLQNGAVQVSWAAALPGVLDATARAALCLAGPGGVVAPGSLGVTCRSDVEGVVIDGTKRYVPYADSAELLLVAADGPGAGVSLLVVPAGAEGVSIEPAPSIAGDRQAEVQFSGARAEPVGPLGEAWDRVMRAVLVGTAALCAEAVGASAALVERTLSHAATRAQFGGPIGQRQAVQHRIADMTIDHLAASGAVEEAFARLGAGLPADVEVAAAKALCGTALLRVAASAHQVWGGTGYLADAGLHHWTRLIKGVDAQFGGAHAQRQALASRLHEGGGWSTHDLG